MKKSKALKPGWLTIEVAVHVGKRRIGKLLPLRVEPGRRFLLGNVMRVRDHLMRVIGFGYEAGRPTVHLLKLA